MGINLAITVKERHSHINLLFYFDGIKKNHQFAKYKPPPNIPCYTVLTGTYYVTIECSATKFCNLIGQSVVSKSRRSHESWFLYTDFPRLIIT